MISFAVLNGPMCNVVQLRSTPPLFKAYEEVYSCLESKYCPAFFKSEEVNVKNFRMFFSVSRIFIVLFRSRKSIEEFSAK